MTFLKWQVVKGVVVSIFVCLPSLLLIVLMNKFKYEEVTALASYCLSSLTITLLNKAVLSSSNFGMNFLLLAVQAVSSILLLAGFKAVGAINFRPIRKQESIQWLPVSLLLIAMIYTGSKTLQYLTVAMFTVFKNLTIIIVALGEQKLFASQITGLMWLSFGLMAAGSIIGGFNDLTFNARGYFWMALNSASNAAYLLYMKGTIKSIGFGDFDSVLYNNVLSLPVLLLLSVGFEDWSGFISRTVYENTLMNNMKLLVSMLLSGFAGFFISFTTAWCLRVAPSTTYSMVGALNKLPVALSGLIFFPLERKAVNFGYICSIIIAFSAGIVYSYAQVLKKKEAEEEAKANVSPMTENTTLTNTKTSIIDMLNEYENRLGIKATYHELTPKSQH